MSSFGMKLLPCQGCDRVEWFAGESLLIGEVISFFWFREGIGGMVVG